MGNVIYLHFLPFAYIFIQTTDADSAMETFVKITGRREDEGAVSDLPSRSKSD
jgi:hypothetical protein